MQYKKQNNEKTPAFAGKILGVINDKTPKTK